MEHPNKHSDVTPPSVRLFEGEDLSIEELLQAQTEIIEAIEVSTDEVNLGVMRDLLELSRVLLKSKVN